MGMCSSTSTQQTTIPPPTPEELALLELAGKSMQTYMDEAGYEITRSEIPFEQTEQGQNFAARRRRIQERIDAERSQPAQQSRGGRTLGGAGVLTPKFGSSAEAEMAALDREENEARKNYKPEVNYSEPRRKADLETEEIRRRYGADSPQYRAAYEAYQQREIAKEKSEQNIDRLILDRTQKLLKGDYSLNEGEQQFLDQLLGPMKQAALNAVGYIESAQTKDQGIGLALENFGKQIQQTKMNMGDALIALEDRVKQTGQDMTQALDDEIEISRQLTQMGLEDFTSQQRLAISNQAAALGRSPSDPKFQLDLQSVVNREIERTGLEFGRFAASERRDIAERTGAGLEDAQRLRLGIEERTGAGMEGIAQARVGYAEEAARMRGQSEMALAENAGNIRSNLAYGLPPQMVGLGTQVGGYQQAIEQQRLNNLAQGGYQMPVGLYGTRAQERYLQPTTTTRTSQSVGSILSGLVGMGLQGYATYAALRPSGGGSGGGNS